MDPHSPEAPSGSIADDRYVHDLGYTGQLRWSRAPDTYRQTAKAQPRRRQVGFPGFRQPEHGIGKVVLEVEQAGQGSVKPGIRPSRGLSMLPAFGLSRRLFVGPATRPTARRQTLVA